MYLLATLYVLVGHILIVLVGHPVFINWPPPMYWLATLYVFIRHLKGISWVVGTLCVVIGQPVCILGGGDD